MGEVGVWREVSDEEHIANLVMAGFTLEEAKKAHQKRLQIIANRKPKNIDVRTQDGVKIDLFMLVELIYKSVKITTKDGEIYSGEVTSFDSSVSSYSGFEEITIEYPSIIEGRVSGIVLQEDEIEKIIVLE